jgi:hypothetical protein
MDTPPELHAGCGCRRRSLSSIRKMWKSGGNPAGLARVDVYFMLFNAAASGDQLDDATDVAADVADIGGGKSVFEISTDEFLIVQINDLEIIVIVALEIMLRPGRRTVQIILERLGDFDPDEQTLGQLFFHLTSPYRRKYHSATKTTILSGKVFRSRQGKPPRFS